MPEGDVGNMTRHAVGHVARRADDHAQLVVGQGRQLGGEAVDRATVADAALALELRDHEAQAEAGLLVLLRELDLVHLFERFALEKLLALGGLAACEQELEEFGLVVDGRIQAAGRRHAKVPDRRRELAAVVGPHERFGEAFAQHGRRVVTAVRHADGGQELALDQRLVLFFLRAFEDVADGGEGSVRVARLGLGDVDQLGVVEAPDSFGQGRAAVVEIVADG